MLTLPLTTTTTSNANNFSLSLRKSWQKNTKFKEHLSFISTTSSFHLVTPIRTHNLEQQSSEQHQPLKSAWSPITPTPHDRTSFPIDPTAPPVPPLPDVSMPFSMPRTPQELHHAEHVQPVERERDVDRDVERARADAAEKLERGSRERLENERLERQRLDREREERERLERMNKQLKQREQYQDSLRNFPRDVDSDVDEGERVGTAFDSRSNFSYRDRQEQQTITQRGKSALTRLSRAVFRFPASPTSTSPYTRDNGRRDELLPHHVHQNPARASRFSRYTKWPSRSSELSPWPALNLHKRDESLAGSQAGQTHYHYYNNPNQGSVSGHESAGQHEYNVNLHMKQRGEKRGHTNCDCHKHKSRKRQCNICYIIVMILLLLLLANTIFLNIKFLSPTSVVSDVGDNQGGSSNGTTTATKTASVTGTRTVLVPQTTGTLTTVSKELSDCLAQFANAGSTAASYPCSQCIPHLGSVANDLVDGTSPPVTGQGRVLQFCALQSVANLTSAPGGAKPLQNVGWLRDTSVCGWNGVTCDDKGRVRDLELVTPGVPSTIPPEMIHLVGLKKLTITGDTNLPGGSPTTIFSIPSLVTLSLDSTGLQGSLSGDEIAGLVNLKQLVLVKNDDLAVGATVGGAASMSLQGLVLTFQGLVNDEFTAILGSTALQQSLTTLDLSSNALDGPIPATISSFTNLVELDLGDNIFSTLPSSSFPPKLKALTLSGNPTLRGSLTSQICTAFTTAGMTSCDLVNTGLTLATGVTQCGPCRLR